VSIIFKERNKVDCIYSVCSAVATCSLPEQGQEFPSGTEAVISGWGRLESDGEAPDELQAAEVTVISDTRCMAAYIGIAGQASPTRETSICATKQGRDSPIVKHYS
jgi:hypothetical protein